MFKLISKKEHKMLLDCALELRRLRKENAILKIKDKTRESLGIKHLVEKGYVVIGETGVYRKVEIR